MRGPGGGVAVAVADGGGVGVSLRLPMRGRDQIEQRPNGPGRKQHGHRGRKAQLLLLGAA
jgi:hypothetical protein